MENVITVMAAIVFMEQSGLLGCATLVSLYDARSYLKIVLVTYLLQYRN